MSKGDLISREALKKEVENLVVGGVEGLKDYYKNGSKSDENAWIGGIYDAWELIDNAPTVEPQDRCGRWVISEVRCPNCLEYFDTDCYSTGELNKCPSCGAKLKGGAE